MVAEPAWFEIDPEDEFELDEIQSSFLGVLRARATTWLGKTTPDCTSVDLHGHDADGHPPGNAGRGRLLAWMDICADDVSLLTVGAYLDGRDVRGDRLHNQLLSLPDVPTSLELNVTGTPVELAGHTAEWFEGLLRRPVVRQEWRRFGAAYAHRYLFADTGEPLVEGRVRTGDLDRPQRTVPVRGDHLG